MKNTPFLAAFAALLLPFSSLAQNADQLVEVKASGYGETVREAYKAALRAAVEQVVGTMIDATTLVENDELIENEILTYAPGMVASAKQIGEPKKTEGGIYIAKVLATVKKGQIEQKLRAASTVNVTLDGADLFARMTAAQENLADAEAMIKDVLAKHTACIVAEPVPGNTGKSPLDYDPKSGEVFANVRVRIDQAKYAQFSKDVIEKLSPMSERMVRVMTRGDGRHNWKYVANGYFDYDMPGVHGHDYEEHYLTVVEQLRTGAATALWFDQNKMSAILSAMDTGPLALSVAVSDATGIEQARAVVRLGRFSNTMGEDGKDRCAIFATGRSKGVIAPIIHSRSSAFNFYSGVSTFNSGDGDYGWTTKTWRVSLGSFTPDELKTAAKLDIKLGHMKDGQFTE